MSSQVVRVQGFTKGSLIGIGNEAERGNVNHRNPDIDPERKHMNMQIKTTEHGFYAEWNRIKTDLNAQGKETKKGIAFEGMIITAEAKFFEERFGWKKGEPMSPELVGYWRECYDWAVKEIGYQGTDKNIISAVVHADETSLHLQLYYVPVTDRWQEKVYAKDEGGHVLRNAKGSPIQAKDENGKTIYRQVEDPTAPKLSRTEFWRVRGGQTSYSQMQDRFHEEIGKKYGLERGEVGSNAKHRTKNQWEEEQAVQKLQNAQNELSEVQQGISTATEQKNALEGEIKALTEQKETLTIEEVKALKAEKTIFGGVKGITYKEVEQLRNTVKEYDNQLTSTLNRAETAEYAAKFWETKANESIRDMESAKREAKKEAYQEYNQQFSKTYDELDRLRKENKDLRRKVENLTESVEYLKSMIKQKLPEMVKSMENRISQIMSRGHDKSRVR